MDDILIDDEITPGSILLVNGPTGTAYQKFFSDGLYHGTNDKVRTLDQIYAASIDPSHVTLVYDAPEDD